MESVLSSLTSEKILYLLQVSIERYGYIILFDLFDIKVAFNIV